MANNHRPLVGVIEPVGGHGGMDYYDSGLCAGLVSAGVSPVLYTSDEPGAPLSDQHLTLMVFRRIFGRDPRWIRGLRFIFGMYLSFVDVLRRHIRIVHYHFFHAGLLQLLLIVVAKALGRRVVVTVHDVEQLVDGASTRWFGRLAYRWSDAIIVHNDFSLHEFVKTKSRPSQLISKVPHGHFLHYYSIDVPRQKARKQLGLKDDAFVLLFFGQLKRSKGLDVLLHALPRAIKLQQSLHLVIAGKEADVPFVEYERTIRQVGVAEHCTYHIGYVPNEAVPTYFRAADLVVLPYRRIYQSGVLLLAMSLEVPVLVSNIPGMLELVKDRQNGFVFSNGDPIALADYLAELSAAPGLRKSVASTALTQMRVAHSWEEIGRGTRLIYEQLLAR